MNKAGTPRKVWLVFSMIILLFLLPGILAHWFYAHPDWLPQHKTNRGQLIAPSVSIQQLGLNPTATDHKWVLMLIQSGFCDSLCQKRLYNMRQIQRALGKDMERVQRVALTREGGEASFGDALHWQTDAVGFTHLPDPQAIWYIIDPIGNIVLSYAADTHPEAILDDLKHLIGVSNIG